MCPWAACCDCARAIAMSGISTLVVHAPRMQVNHRAWTDQHALSVEILLEAGVEVIEYDSPIRGAKIIRVNDKLWSPVTCYFIS